MNDPRCWLFEQVMGDRENARSHAIATAPVLRRRLHAAELTRIEDPRRERVPSGRVGLVMWHGTGAEGPFLLALGLQGRGATRSMVEDEIAALAFAVLAASPRDAPPPSEILAVVVRAGSDVPDR